MRRCSLAARGGDSGRVGDLVEAGADRKTLNMAVGVAAYHGRTETVKFLLDSGADVHADDDYALRWARANGHEETAAVLKDWIERGGNAPATGGNGGAGPEIRPQTYFANEGVRKC